VSVAELMRRKATAHPSSSGRVMQLGADAGGRPSPTGGRASKDAEQRAHRERGASLQPWHQLLPGPAVHPDLTPLAAFASPDQDRAACITAMISSTVGGSAG
jgi:hypothetical protein